MIRKRRLLLALPIVALGIVAYFVGVGLVILEFAYSVLFSASDYVSYGRWVNPIRFMEYRGILSW